MTIINLTTEIHSGIELCFNLSRSIEIHIQSTVKTKEKVIAGKTSGFCELGDSITWEAKHFGIIQKLSVEITKFSIPDFFEDKMIKGPFKSMRHEHHFKEINGNTIMKDIFEYEVPYGIAGKVFNALILKRYMLNFLKSRNQYLKSMAENK